MKKTSSGKSRPQAEEPNRLPRKSLPESREFLVRRANPPAKLRARAVLPKPTPPSQLDKKKIDGDRENQSSRKSGSCDAERADPAEILYKKQVVQFENGVKLFNQGDVEKASGIFDQLAAVPRRI